MTGVNSCSANTEHAQGLDSWDCLRESSNACSMDITLGNINSGLDTSSPIDTELDRHACVFSRLLDPAHIR